VELKVVVKVCVAEITLANRSVFVHLRLHHLPNLGINIYDHIISLSSRHCSWYTVRESRDTIVGVVETRERVSVTCSLWGSRDSARASR
jgi:hypothetical protein